MEPKQPFCRKRSIYDALGFSSFGRPSNRLKRKRQGQKDSEGIGKSYVQGPLSRKQVQQFVHDGFVILKNVVSKSVCNDIREKLWAEIETEKPGVKKLDSRTWPEKIFLSRCFEKEEGHPWNSCFNPRITQALDQLLGKNKWETNSFKMGWWVITFPRERDLGIKAPREAIKTKLVEKAAGSWHVDGAHFDHFPYSRELGLVPIFLFSEIKQDCGGTLLLRKSHQRVASMLWNETKSLEGVPSGKVSFVAREMFGLNKNCKNDFKRQTTESLLFETTGEPGDVLLMHPMMLHCRSYNFGKEGFQSIRPICNPSIAMKNNLNISPLIERMSAPTPVELAILQGIANGQRGGSRDS
jgi:hypothetical protein